MVVKHISIAGCGELGIQIAFHTAYKGFDVSVYDISDEAIEKAKASMEKLKQRYKDDVEATAEAVNNAYHNIRFFTDLDLAVEHAELVIEAVPEVLDTKKEFFIELSNTAPEKSIFASASTAFLPSQLHDFTKRSEKFLMLHIPNELWLNSAVEIVKHTDTDKHVFDQVITFVEQIGMVPLPIHKEQTSFILNNLLIPFIEASQDLLVNGVADAETIDKAWMLGTDSPKGPLAIIDMIGIEAPYNLAKAKGGIGDKPSQKIAEYLKEHYIDKGKLGKESGEGFYTYPYPAYEKDDFLSPRTNLKNMP